MQCTHRYKYIYIYKYCKNSLHFTVSLSLPLSLSLSAQILLQRQYDEFLGEVCPLRMSARYSQMVPGQNEYESVLAEEWNHQMSMDFGDGI